MTFKEQYLKDHPDEDVFTLHEKPFCPSDMEDGKHCPAGSSCKACWDREIPEEKLTFNHTGEPIAKVKNVTVTDYTLTAEIEPIIKDSGDRTEFETGAVRDMREGKGRCDLMPLEVAKDLMTDPRAKKMLENIRNFQKYNDADFLRLCLESFARHTGGCDNHQSDVCTMLLEVSKHYEEGAKKYGESNWQKGIPTWCYIDSAVRHYLKWLRGDNDEPHDRAFVWNLMCCIWEVDYREKMED